jgi:carbon monoxide dehydrogenase subunit G
MKVEKNFTIARPRPFVWSKFSDVEFVAACLPGASIVSSLGDNRYKAKMSVKVGPMAAAFEGELAIETQQADWSGRVMGSGADTRSSSRATGTMIYRLAAVDDAVTRVDIVADFNLAGPLAQFSKGPIVQDIANRITAAFVQNFEARLNAADAPATPGAASQPARAEALDAGNLVWAVLRDRFVAFLRKVFGRPSAER